MDDKVECPYCNEDFEVVTDDGQHYNDGESASDYCPNCEKRVMIYSSCSWYREASKADCLNGISDHDWSNWQKHYPVKDFTQWFATSFCNDCDEKRQSFIDITDSTEDQRRVNMYKEASETNK